jgi:sterol desaturase/sphingolipid hydroxylase (fatty acid hydroxylase superfamily)
LGPAGFLIGVLISSLAEYWIHILMHRGIFLSRTHRNHHREPEGETWFKQFAYYLLGSVLPMAVVCVACWIFDVTPLGIGGQSPPSPGQLGLPTLTLSSITGPSWCFG